jgi:tetratricopeptide (TPR) repeat protein
MTNDFIKKFLRHEDVQALAAEQFNENDLFMVRDGQSYVARLAYTFFKEKKYSQAQTMYEGLVCANPFEPSFHVILGLIYYRTEQKDLAIAQFSEAIDLDPDCYAAYIARAYLVVAKGDQENTENSEQGLN